MELIHLTYSSYLQIILKEGFLISKHEPQNKKIMWLGDGVYFYNVNDDAAIQQGNRLLKNKPNKPLEDNVVIIQTRLNIDDNNILNILNEEDKDFIIKYVQQKNKHYKRKKNNNIIESEHDLKLVLLHIEYFLPFDNDNYGKKLGYLINEMLSELKGIDIDLVSCSFVTDKKFIGNKEDSIEQHALRNLERIVEITHNS